MTTTLSSKGQLTLPAEARKRLGLRAGSRLEVIVKGDDRIELVRVGGSLQDLKGVLPRPKKALSLAEIDRAVVEGALGSGR
jgi:AbrB family looped-hinge helix DNA binding protein